MDGFFLEKSIKAKYTDIENTLEHINFGGPMNLAMLARQGWRLLLSQCFLCAQIFRAKVFAKWITSCLLSKNQVVSVHGEVLFARRKHSKVVCLVFRWRRRGHCFLKRKMVKNDR